MPCCHVVDPCSWYPRRTQRLHCPRTNLPDSTNPGVSIVYRFGCLDTSNFSGLSPRHNPQGADHHVLRQTESAVSFRMDENHRAESKERQTADGPDEYHQLGIIAPLVPGGGSFSLLRVGSPKALISKRLPATAPHAFQQSTTVGSVHNCLSNKELHSRQTEGFSDPVFWPKSCCVEVFGRLVRVSRRRQALAA